MRHTLAYLLPLLFVSTLVTTGATGCALYFDDDDDPCLYGGQEPAPAAEPLPSLRNPYTGLCESFGGGGGGTCDPACGPCDQPAGDAPLAMPTWGYCESACSQLDEATCLATSGCRGAYVEGGGYFDCWAVDMTGPVQGGGCEGLDAWECSLHDDCVAIHAEYCEADQPAGGVTACSYGEFVACAAETVKPVACAQVTDEQTCVGRPECAPYYEGSDCTCDAAGNCECATWTFTRCDATQDTP